MVAEGFQTQVIFKSVYVTFVIDPLAKASHKAKPRISVGREYPSVGYNCSYFCKQSATPHS